MSRSTWSHLFQLVVISVSSSPRRLKTINSVLVTPEVRISSTPVALLLERELMLYLNSSCWIIFQIRWALLVVGCLSCRLSKLSVPSIPFSIPFYVLSFWTFLLLNALLFSRKYARLLAAAHLHASTVVSSSKVNCPTQGRPVPSILLILCRMIHGKDLKPSGCSALVEYCYPRHHLNGTQNCLE